MADFVIKIAASTTTRRTPVTDWSRLRLADCIGARPRVLFVGINPGVRSALIGHHFAGYSNRFWKLLRDAGLVPELLTFQHDRRLPEWGYALTNLVARPSPGIDDLRRQEYVAGWKALVRKVERARPEWIALIGVTLYHVLTPILERDATRLARRRPAASVIGSAPYAVHGARLFVLPNPSGRNANFSYAEMVDAYRGLAQALKRRSPARRPGRTI